MGNGYLRKKNDGDYNNIQVFFSEKMNIIPGTKENCFPEKYPKKKLTF